MPIYAIENLIPVVDPRAFVHPTAVVIGDVIIEADVFVGPNAVIRGDFGSCIIRQGANLQDTCVMHSFPGKKCVVNENGHIGHGAILHGCEIGCNALIGMNAVVMDDTVIGNESLVAATTFVKSSFSCPPRSLIMGNPAFIKKTLTDEEVNWKTQGTKEYQILTARCLKTLREIEPLTRPQRDRPHLDNYTHKPKNET